MLNRFKTAVNNAISNSIGNTVNGDVDNGQSRKDDRAIKFPYSRPDFLNLTNDEVQVSADHGIRPILVPRDIGKIPWKSGYAE